MAGTLTIGTLSDGTNSTSATNCIQGSAKAWVCCDAGSATIYASFNVSSVTYTNNNNRTVNFINAFADSNYASVIGTPPNTDVYGRPYTVNVQSTSNCTFNGIGGTYSGKMSFAFFR